MKEYDWTIEARDTGFYFLEMKCFPAFGSGRYTWEETQLASEEFNKIDNPDVPRTRQEGLDLIEKIKEAVNQQLS